ncbi:class I SAM-dependent methyltransferase [Thermoproteota archaeon]
MTASYYSILDDVYSRYSSNYIEKYWKTRIGLHFRKIVWSELQNHVKPGGLAFDLGAGSGINSIFLARAGMKVLAWDISRDMVENMNQRIKRENLEGMIRVEHRGSHNLSELLVEEPSSFDLVISTFGALNSEPNLPNLIPTFHKIIKNDGVFLGAVYNKFSLYEIIGSFMKADFEKLTRRFGESPYTEIGAHHYPVTVYTPDKFKGILTPYFRTVLQRGIMMGMPSLDMLRIIESIPQQLLDIETNFPSLMEHSILLRFCDQFLNVARPI